MIKVNKSIRNKIYFYLVKNIKHDFKLSIIIIEIDSLKTFLYNLYTIIKKK